MAAKKNGRTEISAGDTFALRFAILTPSGGNPSYSAPIATFFLGSRSYAEPTEDPVLTKTSASGIAVSQSGGAWFVTVTFERSETLSLAGDRHYEVLIEDGTAAQTVATGILRILPTIAE